MTGSSSGAVTARDGARTTYFDEGRGPPIIIVHPGSSDAGSWQAVAAALSSTFRVVRLERRLYRQGEPPPSPHVIGREVDDVAALLDLVREPAILVGHSSGGVVALESALQTPSALAGLVLYEPPVAVTEPLGGEAVVRAKAALARGDTSAAMAIHLRDIVQLPWLDVALVRLWRQQWRTLCAHAAAQIADVEAIDGLGVGLERYRRMAVPSLLLGGADSPPNLRRRLDALAAVLPTVRNKVIMTRQGHAAHLSAPEELATIIRDFAASVRVDSVREEDRTRA
jgi:pimeloyl-ACP methyl ester carboxylesterase